MRKFSGETDNQRKCRSIRDESALVPGPGK